MPALKLNVHVCCNLPHNNWMTVVGAFSFDEIEFYCSQTRILLLNDSPLDSGWTAMTNITFYEVLN